MSNWCIVDRDGLTGLPSDETAALSILVAPAARAEEAQAEIARLKAALEITTTITPETITEMERCAREAPPEVWSFEIESPNSCNKVRTVDPENGLPQGAIAHVLGDSADADARAAHIAAANPVNVLALIAAYREQAERIEALEAGLRPFAGLRGYTCVKDAAQADVDFTRRIPRKNDAPWCKLSAGDLRRAAALLLPPCKESLHTEHTESANG